VRIRGGDGRCGGLKRAFQNRAKRPIVWIESSAPHASRKPQELQAINKAIPSTLRGCKETATAYLSLDSTDYRLQLFRYFLAIECRISAGGS
jgi:hypothetical protein